MSILSALSRQGSVHGRPGSRSYSPSVGSGQSWDPVLDKVRRDVAEHGYHLMYVGPGDGDPSMAYTVGLWKSWRHPELLVAGHTMNDSNAILSAYAEAVRNGQRFHGGSVDDDQFNLPVAFLPITAAAPDGPLSDRFAVAHVLAETGDFEALQVVTPDDAGRFPWDEDCDAAVVQTQPVLGPRPT